ncbi:hypothetical protein ACMA5I_02925 [Paracoccaceae bacterium GXU_MW_L88]
MLLVAVIGVVGGLAMISQGDPSGWGLIIGAPLYAIMLGGIFFIAVGIYKNIREINQKLDRLD